MCVLFFLQQSCVECVHAVTTRTAAQNKNTKTSRRQNYRLTLWLQVKIKEEAKEENKKHKKQQTNHLSLYCACVILGLKKRRTRRREKLPLLAKPYSVDKKKKKKHFLVCTRNCFISQASRLVIVLQCGHKLSASPQCQLTFMILSLVSSYWKSWR